MKGASHDAPSNVDGRIATTQGREDDQTTRLGTTFPTKTSTPISRGAKVEVTSPLAAQGKRVVTMVSLQTVSNDAEMAVVPSSGYREATRNETVVSVVVLKRAT